MNELISVIVPVYNVKNYLNACIDSILAQTHSNLEIILIDDGSTDGSQEICDFYEEKDARVKVFHKKNGGVSRARNHGLAHANGDFISFVDSDDIIDTRFYELMLELIRHQNADVAMCSMQRFSNDSEIENKQIDVFPDTCYILDADMACAAVFGKSSMTYASASNKLYSKKKIEGLSFPEGKVYEDAFFIKQLLASPITIVYIDAPLYHYRYVKGSILHKKISKQHYDICTLHEEYAKDFLSSDNQDLYTLSRLHYYNCLEQLYVQAKNGKSEQTVIDFFYKKLIALYEELKANRLLKKNQQFELFLLKNFPMAYLFTKKLHIFVKRLLNKFKKI